MGRKIMDKIAEFKKILLERGLGNPGMYRFTKNSSRTNRGLVKPMIANSMHDYLQNNDFLTCPIAVQAYSEILENIELPHKEDTKTLSGLCQVGLNHEINGKVQYSTIQEGIDQLIQKVYGERIEFKTKVEREYDASGHRSPKIRFNILYLDQDKFDKFILENTELAKEVLSEKYP